jgi:serine/threonine protein kinase
MGPLLACPEANVLENLSRGLLPPEEMEALLAHVESCERCQSQMQSVPRSDTLLDAVGQAGTVPEDPDERLIAGLVERVKGLGGERTLGGPARGQDESVAQAPAADRITFACSHCGKSLKAKVQLAGKKVKCPGCGQAAQVPGGVSGSDDRTMPPRELAPASVPAKSSEQTEAGAHAGSEEVWDFLAPPQAPDEVGRLGSYRILQVLGHGGMGVVFRAEDPGLKRVVALKAMLPALAASPSAKKRFLREAQTAASIKHDHIVTIYQVGEDRGAPYLAMEFLHGEPLDARLKREGRLPIADALRIGWEVAEGLAAAHDAGLIHRDIKPANIWLESVVRRPSSVGVPPSGGRGPAKAETPTGHGQRTKDSRAKILDFGLARAMDDQAGLTQTGAIIGTPAYMAPEQASGRNVDHRCDLFSLGSLLYVMSTGKQPFKGEDTISTLMSVSTMEAVPPLEVNPAVPEELSDLILRLLAKKPQDRPQDAHEVAASLRALQAPGPDDVTGEVSRREPARKPARVKSRRGLLVACGLGLAAALLLALGIVFFFPSGDGTIRVEVNDKDIKVAIDQGELKIVGADGKAYTVTPGLHGLKVKHGNIEFETDKFTLRKGETLALKVELLQGKLQVAMADGKIIGAKGPAQSDVAPLETAWTPTAEQKAFLDAVGILAEDKRVEAVTRKLIEVCGPNPRPPAIVFEPKDKAPVRCVYSTGYAVNTIWPLAALSSLRSVDLTAAAVRDFTPLARLPLTEVKLFMVLDNHTSEAALKAVPTLKTINGRPASEYWAARAKVRDNIDRMAGKAAALSVEDRRIWLEENLKLLHPDLTAKDFNYSGNEKWVSFSPGNKPIDLTPLRGVGVDQVNWGSPWCFDLRPLAKTGLKRLGFEWARNLSDLSPLAGLPLTHLSIHGSVVADLRPLAGMKLESFVCIPANDNNGGPFLLADLSPLKGMPLKEMDITGSQVADLRPLAGTKLTKLNLQGTPVTDLSPLKGLPLEVLKVGKIGDISALKGLPLNVLEYHFRLHFEPDEKLLRSLPLEWINGAPVAEFWKDVEKRRKADEEVIAWMAKVPVEAEALKKAIWDKVGQYPPVKIVDGALVESGVNDGNGARDCLAAFVAFPKLRKLTLNIGPGVCDYSPLLKLPLLEELECQPAAVAYNLPVLRLMPKLKTINGKSAKAVLGGASP